MNLNGNKAYSEFELKTGLLFNYSNNQYPTKLYAWTDKLDFKESNSTYYGYVFEGPVTLQTSVGDFNLSAQMYFCQNESFSIKGGSGIVIERINYRGMNMIGGPLEEKGRLKYIDGCTDSLLVSPVKMGDPCLNALYFPPNTDQTAHTHPSMRVGMVVNGQGTCITPHGEYNLSPGMVFIIHEEGSHKFKTDGDSRLTVIAYHPDSDFGPEDEDHPMINRTMVEGVSAAKLKEIQTV